MSTQYKSGEEDSRPWGRWRVLEADAEFTLKKIEVATGQRLSLQYHDHRSEHWVMVQGKGRVTLDDKLLEIASGQHVYIPQGTRHRIENTGKEPLIFLEVQVGDRLEETDIVRLEDDYARSQ